MCLLILPLYLTALAFLIPIYILCFIWDLIFSFSLIPFLPSLTAFLYELMVYLPLFAILSIRYLFYQTLDTLFFSTLKHINSEFATKLEAIPYLALWVRLKKFASRTIKKLLVAGCLLCLSFIPGIGPFIIPAAQFYATTNVLGMQVALVSAIISCLPLIRNYSVLILGTFYAAESLFQELLDPYLGRSVDHYHALRLKSRKSFVSYGFSVPLTIALSIPIVGPFSFPLMQAAAANFLSSQYDKEKVNAYEIPVPLLAQPVNKTVNDLNGNKDV